MDKLRSEVKKIFKKYIPAHDIKHVLRVAALARKIARAENYDPDEAEAAGLIHDLGRTMAVSEEELSVAGIELARALLTKCCSFSEQQIETILDAAMQHSKQSSKGKLANILQDADKLDGMGAVGLLRAFTYDSGILDYVEPISTEVKSPYPHPATLMEMLGFIFEWEKMLYTKTAKDLALRRMAFMRQYVQQLKSEIEEGV